MITFDADGQMDVHDAESFITSFETDTSLDAVIGSRLLDGSVIRNMPCYRKFIVLF